MVSAVIHNVGRAYGRRPHAWNAALLCLLVFAVYGRSLDGGFVWDDVGLIVKNPDVQSPSGWSALLHRSFWSIGECVEDPTRSFYRPLISISYALDYGWWGLSPRGFHLANLAAHAFTTIAAYALAGIVLGAATPALLAAALFAVHPTHVENVAWISGRTDVFCGLFYFLALVLFAIWLRSSRRLAWLVPLLTGSYLLALLSKETAITFPGLALGYQVLVHRRRKDGDLALVWLPLVLTTAVYLILRVAVLGEAVAPAAFGTAWERFGSIPMVFARDLGSLLALVPVDPHHDMDFVRGWTDLRLWAGIAVSAGYTWAMVHAFRRGARRMAFLLAWIPLTLLPTFKLGAFGDVLHADRFLYIPSLGFAAGLVRFVSRAAWPLLAGSRARKGLGIGACALAIASLAGTGILDVGVWHDNRTLFARAARTSPRSSYIFYNLGNAYAEAGRHGDAVAAFSRAVALEPGYGEALTNMGISLGKMGRHREALDCYQRALARGDRSTVLFSGMGVSYRSLGQTDAAEDCYRRSLAVRATAAAHNNLGECLLARGEIDAAERHFNEALRLQPGAAVYDNLALASIRREDYRAALAFLDRAMVADRHLPADIEIAVQYNYAQCLTRTGRAGEAAAHARRVLALAAQSPQNARYAEVPWIRELAEGK